MNLDPAALATWTAANRRASRAEPVDWCQGVTYDGEPCDEPATPGRPICKACAQKRTAAANRMRRLRRAE